MSPPNRWYRSIYVGYPGMVAEIRCHGWMKPQAGLQREMNPSFCNQPITIKYRQPVPTNQLLKVRGRLLKKRGKVSQAYGEIRNQDGELLAEAEGIFVEIAEDFTQGTNPELMGWKVYQDE